MARGEGDLSCHELRLGAGVGIGVIVGVELGAIDGIGEAVGAGLGDGVHWHVGAGVGTGAEKMGFTWLVRGAGRPRTGSLPPAGGTTSAGACGLGLGSFGPG